MAYPSAVRISLIALLLSVCLCDNFFCGEDAQAWVWNCQSILDNWTLDDNTEYTDTSFNKCVTNHVANEGGSDDIRICTVAENDSCVVYISGSKKQGDFPPVAIGSDIKSFVQKAVDQCAVADKLSAGESLEKSYLSLAVCSDASLCKLGN